MTSHSLGKPLLRQARTRKLRAMVRSALVHLVAILWLSSPLFAQTNEPNTTENPPINPRFAMMAKEVSAVCGVFLPSDIPGITEYMSLCGGRFGFKISENTRLEPQILTGAGKAQRYILGSLSFRGDVQLDDLYGSIYGGADIHYATQPVYSGGAAIGEQTNLYFGAHLGGAVWWEFTENLFLRTDLQFMLNPGTSLFVGFSLVLRFDPTTENGGGAPPPTP